MNRCGQPWAWRRAVSSWCSRCSDPCADLIVLQWPRAAVTRGSPPLLSTAAILDHVTDIHTYDSVTLPPLEIRKSIPRCPIYSRLFLCPILLLAEVPGPIEFHPQHDHTLFTSRLNWCLLPGTFQTRPKTLYPILCDARVQDFTSLILRRTASFPQAACKEGPLRNADRTNQKASTRFGQITTA